MRISVVIPTLNEAASIGRVLGDLPAGLVSEVIVVDGGSVDGTPSIAERMGARVLREPRHGYGRACLAGLAHAAAPEIVVFLDGDYSDRPAELPRLLEPIVQKQADVVLGSRLGERRQPGAVPWHAVLGNRVAAALVNRLYGLSVTDLGPFRAARHQVLAQLDLAETTYGWAVEMIVKAARLGFRVTEVPVSYYPRIGRSKISGTVRGSFGAAFCIFTTIFSQRPRRRGPAPVPVSSPSSEAGERD
jgi:glycosyltransferase involved in cell wall biosynthesis